MSRHRPQIALLLLAGWSLTASVASAQEPRGSLPRQSLFTPPAPSVATTNGPRATTMRASFRAFTAVQVDTPIETVTAGAFTSVSQPVYGGVAFDGSREHRSARYSYDLQGSTQLRQRRSRGGSIIDNQWVAAAVLVQLTRRTTIAASQRMAYAPRDASLTPPPAPAAFGQTEPADPAPRAAVPSSLAVASAVVVSTALSRRTAVSLEYRYDRLGFSSTWPVVSSQQTSVALTRALTRTASGDLTLQVRYGYVRSTTTTPGDTTASGTHVLDAGLTYRPPLSRRTTIAFGVAPNVISRASSPASVAVAAGPGSGLKLGGFVSVDHLLTRVWRAGAGYQRLLYFAPGYDRPILADAVTGRIGGRTGPMAVAVSGAYSAGTPNGQNPGAHITSISSAARLEYRPSGSTTLYGEYVGDVYTQSVDLALVSGVNGRVKRSTIRVGLTINLGGGSRTRVQESRP